MANVIEGGCLCGDLRYAAELPLVDTGYCHCRLCQRANAAPAVAWATVRAEQFSYSRGQPSIFHSSATYQREFCARCGSQLVFRRQGLASLVDFTLATLDDPNVIAPEYHIWRMSKLDWFDTADALPRHQDAGPDSA
jgi:hypothetical protein